MIYISTDYVFDGQAKHVEPDCKAYAPLNVYGQSKLGGELAVAQTLEKYLSFVSPGYLDKRKEFYQNHVAGSKKITAGARGK